MSSCQELGCRGGCAYTETAQGGFGSAGTILYPDCAGGYINPYLCETSELIKIPESQRWGERRNDTKAITALATTGHLFLSQAPLVSHGFLQLLMSKDQSGKHVFVKL